MEIGTQSAEHARISASITSSWKGSSGNMFESVLELRLERVPFEI